MSRLLLRAPLGALLLTLLVAGCDDGGLTAPEAAAPSTQGLAALFDNQLDAAETADAVPDARAFAASAGLAVQPITGPTTITAPGVYAVTQDFSLPAGVAADAIVVQSSNVFLDLGAHTITGPGNKIGRGVVVMGTQRVIVRGGTLETFGVGVEIHESTRVAVAGVHVVGGDEFADPPNGIPPQVGFLLLNSPQNRLFGNRATDVNLGYFDRGPKGMRNSLVGNAAFAGENGLLGICFNPLPNAPPTDPGPSHELVQNNVLHGFGTGIQVQVGSANNRFIENVIYFYDAAWEDANGTNVFRRNVTVQL